jgi:predicted PurR-regulated permease PerM
MDENSQNNPAAPDADRVSQVAIQPSASSGEPLPLAVATAAAPRMVGLQFAMVVLGGIAFLYFARPIVMPMFLAVVSAMALMPFMRWLGHLRLPPAASAAIVLCLLVAAIGVGISQLGRPARKWIDGAPEHMTELRQRFLKVFPSHGSLDQAAEAVTNLGASEKEIKDEQRKSPTVAVKETRGTGSILNWTGTFLMGGVETLILLYLLLASGDMFLHKLVRSMPTLRDKKRAIEINNEIQENISKYLATVSLINVGLGLLVTAGLYFMGVPNAALWGIFAAVLNFVPYFGAVAGVLLLSAVGILTFDTLGLSLLPAAWYLLLHLLEANLLTPVLLGRRFTLNPVVIFISLIFWMWLWGVPGALLSVPILVSIKVVCDRVPSMSPVSELLSRA